MARFLAGDARGRILAYDANADLATLSSSPIYQPQTQSAVHALAVASPLVAACFQDGSALAGTLEEQDGKDHLTAVHRWSEPRLRKGQRYVGCAIAENTVYTCTSNGALRSITYPSESSSSTTQKGVLPMRLSDWRLAPSETTFAYGGDEVELSVWNLDRALDQPSAPAVTEKRKRGSELLPGETWRARNVENDGLSLRAPVHITSLTYLSHPATSSNHILTGSRLGNVRRYDTRAGRRPVSDWKDVGRVGGVKLVQAGSREHEAFVADQGCNLLALDLRTGGTMYAYKGMSGAISSLAITSTGVLASTSNDHYFRLYSTHPPPVRVGSQQEHKGTVLCQVYDKMAMNAIAWDGILEAPSRTKPSKAEDALGDHSGDDGDDNEEDGDVWEGMLGVSEDEDEDVRRAEKSAKRRKK